MPRGDKRALDRMNPAGQRAKPGTKINAVISLLTQLRTNSLTRCFTDAALAAAVGNDGQAKSVATAVYAIAGKIYTKAATDPLWDCTGLTDTGAAEYCKVLFCLDAAGTATVVQGANAASQGAALIPAADAVTKCPIGYVEVANSHTFATDALAGTMYELTVVPDTTALDAAVAELS